ncbi:MAG: hypothetical protein M0Z60_02910, partial [Nitrospiraceae bacterium]|nr:hypothetical protein [Nitrospiraceae bacterium]
MREKLELKILALVVVLLLIGIVAAGFMVLTIEKRSLYSLTAASSEATAKVIAKDVERTMLEGRADLAKSLLAELKGASGAEEVALLNYEGRQAFDKSSPPTEAEIMREIAQTKAPKRVQGVTQITFYKPLENTERCRTCHANDPAVLGAVKTSISIAKEYDNAKRLI